MSFVEFVVDTWESDCRPAQEATSGTKRGHPLNPRATYIHPHLKAGMRERVRRAPGHNTLPNIVDPYRPRSDNPETYQFYCASMLALLQPWRQDIRHLFPDGKSWAAAFDSFLSSAKPWERNFVSSAQLYYQCMDAADKARAEPDGPVTTLLNGLDADVDDTLREDHNTADINLPEPTEAEMILFLEAINQGREFKHGREAIDIALGTALFPKHLNNSWSVSGPSACPATDQDLQNIGRWGDAMAQDAALQKARGDDAMLPLPTSDGSVTALSASFQSGSTVNQGGVVPAPIVQDVIVPVETSHLKPDQARAFEIVKQHLTALLSGRSPTQLLMQVQGEGGTGKSMVIHCITMLFRSHGAECKLIRCAYTGIAASLIDGNTLHTLCRLSRKKGPPGSKVLEELRHAWKDVGYLIIDEVSMIGRDFLERVSTLLQMVKQQSGEPINILPFGGIHVIISGDFHQFPPVAQPNNALYCLYNKARDPQDIVAGRDTYKKFKTVVILQEQCRTTDEKWLGVLRRARTGTCTPADLAIIQNLIMNSDFSGPGRASVDDPVWQDAVLITPRHGVRLAWNEIAVRKHCARRNEQLLICRAEDTISGRPVTISDEYQNAKAKQKRADKSDRASRKEKANLPDVVELAVGMEVMVTYNVETDLDVANGARGVVEKIILDRREEIGVGRTKTPRERTLAHPPECVLVKLTRTKAHKLPDLSEGVVPIVPMERCYDIRDRDGKRHQVTRRQLPITRAYAFTDYRSQGQTIRRVIVDIGRPPSGRLTPFNAYVVLSRSSGQESIRLLRDFDDRLFTNTPTEALRMEDIRLMNFYIETKRKWEAGEVVWEWEHDDDDD